MNLKNSSQARTSPQTRELLRKLSAGLSREELEEVLSGALSSLDEAALKGLQKRLDPDTAASLERSLKASDADSVKAGRAKIMQEWKLLWSEWNEILSKACDEDGPYVIHEHHWEEPYYDPTALADDLDGVAARMAPLAGRVFEENLAPDFSFAGTVKEIMDDVSGGLPDWLEAFVDGLDLGPRTTACLIDWEWRAAKREGKNAFEFLDRLRELEYDSAGLSLDGEALRGFARRLGEADQRLVLEGLRQSREVDRWKEALGCLDQRDYEDWRFRRVPYLERVIKTNLKRISFIMITVRKNSLNGKLKPSRTAYMSWGKGPKDQLRFSKSGNPPIEQLWTTHFVKQRRGQAEAAGAGDAAKETGDRRQGPSAP